MGSASPLGQVSDCLDCTEFYGSAIVEPPAVESAYEPAVLADDVACALQQALTTT